MRLTNYAAVIWACGLESTADESFSATKPVILAFAPESATLSWQAIPGKRYRVQQKTDLAAPFWSSLGADVIATNNLATKVDTNTVGARQKFYRVVMLEP